MEIKLIKYLNKELKKKNDNSSMRAFNDPNLDDTQAIFFDMNYRDSVNEKKKPKMPV